MGAQAFLGELIHHVKIRNQRLSTKRSLTKSMLQRWFGRVVTCVKNPPATPPLDLHLPRGAQEESCPPVRQRPE
jgi:hypothetical protein